MAPFLLILSLHLCVIQKPAIDTAAIDHWPSLLITPTISAHGGYLAYNVSNASSPLPRLIIRSTHSAWRKEFAGVTRCYFSADERQAVLPKNDSLLFLSLGTDSERAVHCWSFQWPAGGDGRWLAYQQQKDGPLLLVNLRTNKSRDLGEANQYVFDIHGRVLIVRDSAGLVCINLRSGDRRRFYSMSGNTDLQDIEWDQDGRRLAFVIREKTSSIWYYFVGDSVARLRARGADIGAPVQFSANGRWLFYTRRGAGDPLPVQPSSDGKTPLIWSWQDARLQPDVSTGEINHWVAVTTDHINTAPRELQGWRLLVPPSLITGNWVLVNDSAGYSLISLSDGGERRIKTRGGYPDDFEFSPGGRWFVYYDPGESQYIGCDLNTGAFYDISARLPRSVSAEFPHGVDPQAVAEPAGWLPGDRAILLYDNYDLWAVDPRGLQPPLNLTGGYGYRHHVKLRLTEDGSDAPLVFSPGDTLQLAGFNTINKYNGFFRLVLGEQPQLDSLIMGPYTFYRVESQKPHRYSFDDGMKPLKAAAADCWLVKRESACEAPNYFLTTDFRQFEPMTALAPQKGYNWLTAELVDYPMPDGSTGQGIMYKPEDFDPTKKYPVLFNIYERYSHRLYEFPPPGLCRDNINIPWFVSRGYLVFTPDIRYRPANVSNQTIGDWASNSVIAAARRLMRSPFVDARRLGIQGHSLGGEETNDVLVATGMFSAAAEMAGPTDPISAYLTLLPAGYYPMETRENQNIWEQGQARMGATPWQRPDLYLRESAVLRADKITTPLLIVHNPQDGAVQGRQGVELFMALRRLKKPVWLLQYPGEDHSFFQRDAALDYTRRMTDFFDYFLKDCAEPAWMTSRR